MIIDQNRSFMYSTFKVLDYERATQSKLLVGFEYVKYFLMPSHSVIHSSFAIGTLLCS